MRWAEVHHITLLVIQPGKPAQNAYIERFNRTYREAILDMYLFDSLQEVKQLTAKWIKHYTFQTASSGTWYAVANFNHCERSSEKLSLAVG